MILTGKCKDDFSYKYNISNFNEYSEVLQNALIIEFFDSVGIIISITEDSFNYVDEEKNKDYWYSEFSYFIKTYSDIEDGLNDYEEYYSIDDFNNRKEATTEAIKQANEIYNERKI